MSEVDLCIKEEMKMVNEVESPVMDSAVCPKPLIPNKETVAAMKELERGQGLRFASVQALMANLADRHETR